MKNKFRGKSVDRLQELERIDKLEQLRKAAEEQNRQREHELEDLAVELGFHTRSLDRDFYITLFKLIKDLRDRVKKLEEG